MPRTARTTLPAVPYTTPEGYRVDREASTGFLVSTDPNDASGFGSWYLTECCHASAKGLENYVGCRACYREVDPALGGIPGQPETLGTVYVIEIPDAPALDPRPIPALPTGGLWASNGGTITCAAHGGGYLASAIAARPKARRHTTPLDVWTKYTAATWRTEVEEFRAAGLPDPACESCP